MLISHEVLYRLSGLLVLAALIIWPLRKIVALGISEKNIMNKIHYWLRKQHKWIGLMTIIAVSAHCCVAEILRAQENGQSKEPLVVAHGILALLLLLALIWLLRKPLEKYWLILHRLFALLVSIMILCHALFKM